MSLVLCSAHTNGAFERPEAIHQPSRRLHQTVDCLLNYQELMASQ